MKNNILTSRQYGILAFLLSFVFKFSLLPGLIAEVAGRDMWLVITSAVLIEAGMLAVIVRISALGGMEAVKDAFHGEMRRVYVRSQYLHHVVSVL